MVLAAPGPLLTPPSSSSPPKTPHRSFSAQIRSQNEEKKHPPQNSTCPYRLNVLSPPERDAHVIEKYYPPKSRERESARARARARARACALLGTIHNGGSRAPPAHGLRGRKRLGLRLQLDDLGIYYNVMWEHSTELERASL
jgi:hypothetical protein